MLAEPEKNLIFQFFDRFSHPLISSAILPIRDVRDRV